MIFESLGTGKSLDLVIFYFLTIWITLIYFMLSLSNPGRIEDQQEKFFLNQRFERLNIEL